MPLATSESIRAGSVAASLGKVTMMRAARSVGSGLNIPSTRELAERSGLDVIASGGVHTIEDVIAAKDAGLAGCIIGRALYDGTVELADCLRQSE